jgi:hypothetical protein
MYFSVMHPCFPYHYATHGLVSVVDKLTSRQIKIVKDKYLDGNPDLSVEKVMRSSKACGPLYQVSVSGEQVK